MAFDAGTIYAGVKLQDHFTSAFNKIGQGLQAAQKWPKGLEASLADLEKQLQKVAKTPGLRNDAASIAQSIAATNAQNRALEENIIALKKGPQEYAKLNREREVANKLLAAGVTRESEYGKQLEASIRKQQQYQIEQKQLIDGHKRTHISTKALETGFISLNSSVTKLSSSFAFQAAIAGGFVALLRSIFKNTAEAEKATALLTSRIQATGGSAGKSIEQLEKLATKFERLTGVEDELIMESEATLATFRRMPSESFEPALKAALNLAAGTDSLNDKVKLLGRAMEDPVKGISRLERQGILLSKAQKDNIKDFAEHGQKAKANAIILAEVEKRAGGAAEALRDTLGGSVKALSNAWGNLMEEIGKSSGGGGMLRTGIEGVVSALEYLKDNWNIFESAIFTVLGNISDRLARFVAFWIDRWADAAKALKIFIDLTSFGQVDTSGIERFGGTLRDLADNVRQTGKYLKEGFDIKAEEAAIGSTSKAVKGLADDIEDLGEESEKAAKKLQALIDKVRGFGVSASEAKSLAFDIVKSVQSMKGVFSFQDVDTTSIGDFSRELAKRLREFDAAAKEAKLSGDKIESLRAQIVRFTSEEFAAKGLEDLNRKLLEFAKAGKETLDNFQDVSLPDWYQDAGEQAKGLLSTEQKRALTIEEANKALQRGAISLDEHRKIVQQNTAVWVQQTSEIERQFETVFAHLSGIFEGFAGSLGNFIARSFDSIDEAIDGLKQDLKSVLVNTVADYIQQWLSMWFKAFAAWLARWIVTQRAAQAASAATGAMSGAGGVSSGVGSLMGGAGKLMGGGSGAGSGGSSAWMNSALAGWGIAIAGMYWILTKSTRDAIQTGAVSLAGEATGNSKKLKDSIRKVVDSLRLDIMDAMDEFDLTFTALGNVFLGQTGKLAFVKDGFASAIGKTFDSMEAAVDYFKVRAIQLAEFTDKTSKMVQDAIRGSRAQTMQGLGSDISLAREIESFGFDKSVRDLAAQLQELGKWFDDTSKRAMDLYRNSELLPDVLSRLKTEFGGRIQDIVDQLLGRQKSEAEIFSSRKEIIEQWIAAQIEALHAERDVVAAQVAAMEGRLQALAEGVEIEGHILHIQLQGLEAMKARLVQIDEALAELGKIDLNFKPPKGGGGRGTGSKDNIRDFIADRTFELAIAKLSDYRQEVARTIKEYDEQIKLAGKDAKLRGELIALKEKELALMAEEQGKNTLQSFHEFTNLAAPFNAIRDTAKDLIDSINDSPFGDKRKANMIGAVLEELDRKLQSLSDQRALSLFGEMIADLEKFGADEALLVEARKAQAVLEHGLKMLHYQEEIALLIAQGKLSAKNREIFEKALEALGKIDPTMLLGGSGPTAPLTGGLNNLIEAADRFNETARKARDEAQSLLDKYRPGSRKGPLSEINQVLSDFSKIRDVLGNTPEVVRLFRLSLQDAIDNLLDNVRKSQEEMFFSELNPHGVFAQWNKANEEFLQAQTKWAAGDISVADEAGDIVKRLREITREISPRGSTEYTTLFDMTEKFLDSIGALSMDDVIQLGSRNNPMYIDSIDGLLDVNSEQLSVMGKIWESNKYVGEQLKSINGKIGVIGGLANVA